MHLPTQSSPPLAKRRNNDIVRTLPLMGTFVTIHVVAGDDERSGGREAAAAERAVEHAFEWFHYVEGRCTRFDPNSELMRLTKRVGVAVRVSTILYEAVQFALAVAEESGGAFDPTVGHTMETRGFNRNYVTGSAIRTVLAARAPDERRLGTPGFGITIGSERRGTGSYSREPNSGASYKDVQVDPDRQTITFVRPLVLDLGAVAKGMAVDLAARELQDFKNFAINAGGDLYLGGTNPEGEPWSIGIRHPRVADQLIDTLRISNRAVCTSGDYERRVSKGEPGHHILDPRTGSSANAAASVTVIAAHAMLADALATAAFALGPGDGIQLLERYGVDGLIISTELERYATRGLCAYRY
jgi:FAD:protein FMN transferase